MCRVFSFFWFFFEFFMLIWILVKPTFDQHLSNFKTWKWKGKHGSFLVTPKWSNFKVLFIFMTQNWYHLSSPLTSYDDVRDITLGTWFFRSHVYRSCLSTWIVSKWHYKTMCGGFPFFRFFLIFMLISILVKPTFDQYLNKFKTWK